MAEGWLPRGRAADGDRPSDPNPGWSFSRVQHLRRRLFAAVAGIAVAGCAPTQHANTAGIPEIPPASQTVADSAPRAPAPAHAPQVHPSRLAGASRIGPDDLLEVTVLEAAELNRTVRVAGTGRISLPLLGEVPAAGLTARELELALEAGYRQRYIRDPHVSVRLSEMRSHAVSVVGAVVRPGVFQLGEPRPLLEVLALAGGLAADAGERVVVVRGRATAAADPATREAPAAPAEGLEVDLGALFDDADATHNVLIHPGDVIRVGRVGVVYVVGEVRRPGAFPLERRRGLTVLQAIALGEGLGPKAARGRLVVIRTSPSGERREVPVDLGDVVAGRSVDLALQPQDVVFVPTNAARVVSLGVVDALVRMVTFRGVF